MSQKIKESSTHSATRHYASVMAFAICGALIYGALYYFTSVSVLLEEGTHVPIQNQINDTLLTATSSYIHSEPVRLNIPTINLDTTFVPPLGLNPDKTVSIPDSYTEVGWYKYGVTPGEIGSSVILGHVDSHLGPAVFFSLGQLKKGDEVFITRADDTEVVFEVIDMERVSQDAFPTEKVYGKIGYAGLRLVTCTGVYNRVVKEYSHNLIVYAKLKTESGDERIGE
jgi:LPXTG-site transpeptidase (sortase) family protein